MRRGKHLAAIAQFLKMAHQRAAKTAFRLAPRAAVRHATRHVWRIRKVTGARFLNHDQIFFHSAGDTGTLWSENSDKSCERCVRAS